MLYELGLRYLKLSVIIFFVFSSTIASIPETECGEIYDEIKPEFPWLTQSIFYIIYFTSRYNSIDPRYVCSVIHYESYDPKHRPTLDKMLRAISPSGARGLMQVMPYHYRGPAKHLERPSLNIRLGTKYLRRCLRKSQGDIIEASRMYNAGLNNKRERYRNWTNYVIPITKKYVRLTGRILDSTFCQYLGLHLARQ